MIANSDRSDAAHFALISGLVDNRLEDLRREVAEMSRRYDDENTPRSRRGRRRLLRRKAG